MLVPETAVDKDEFAPARKNQIRGAREVRTMKPVAVTHRVDQPTHCHFWLGALGADVGHYLATPLWPNNIYHAPTEFRAKGLSLL